MMKKILIWTLLISLVFVVNCKPEKEKSLPITDKEISPIQDTDDAVSRDQSENLNIRDQLLTDTTTLINEKDAQLIGRWKVDINNVEFLINNVSDTESENYAWKKWANDFALKTLGKLTYTFESDHSLKIIDSERISDIHKWKIIGNSCIIISKIDTTYFDIADKKLILKNYSNIKESAYINYKKFHLIKIDD